MIEAPRKPEKPPANERIVPIKVLDTPVTNSPHKSSSSSGGGGGGSGSGNIHYNSNNGKSNGNCVRFKEPLAETCDI